MWEFAIALLLINIWPDTMLLVALFGFTESVAVVFAGPIIGDWVDTHPRLEVVRTIAGTHQHLPIKHSSQRHDNLIDVHGAHTLSFCVTIFPYHVPVDLVLTLFCVLFLSFLLPNSTASAVVIFPGASTVAWR